MKKRGTEISVNEFIDKISYGGWVASRLNLSGIKDSERELFEVSSGYKMIMIEFCGGRAVPVNQPTIMLTTPWSIDVYRRVMRQQKKKLVDGGGSHDVFVDELAFQLTNDELRKKEQAARQLAEEEKEMKAREYERRFRRSTLGTILAVAASLGVGGGPRVPHDTKRRIPRQRRGR